MKKTFMVVVNKNMVVNKKTILKKNNVLTMKESTTKIAIAKMKRKIAEQEDFVFAICLIVLVSEIKLMVVKKRLPYIII